MNVVVGDDTTCSTITKALQKLGFFNREVSIPERLADFPETERKCLERSFALRQEGNSFYNSLAVYPLAPRILDIQYAKIFDTIYMIKALLGDFIGVDTPCLDIGTCTGVMPIIFSSFRLGKWTGIDRSASCIEYAARSAMELLGEDLSPSFSKASLEKLSTAYKFKLVLNSRGPKMHPGENDYTLVSDLLEDNGVFVHVDTPIKNADIARKIYNKSGLSLVYRDVVGGLMRTSGEFEAASFSVFVKCKHDLPAGSYMQDYETVWQSHFMDYCNNEVVDRPELKTLCTMREHKRHSASS